MFAVMTCLAAICLSLTESCLAQSVFIPEQIVFCEENVPLMEGDVRDRLETQLMILSNQKVQVTLWFKRKDFFLPYIENVLEKRKLPPDLKYVPVIESALIMRARSSSNALGLWQFLSPTGKEKGLMIGDGIDERLNLEKSTHAALDYLVYLRSTFGSWSLALAAYNLGQGRIKDEIYNQGTSNYYEMILPDETERYVFNAISAKLIFENPQTYGFDPNSISSFKKDDISEISFKTANFIPVKMLAFCAGTTYRAFRNLNPWITGVNLEKGSYTLKIPAKAVSDFQRKVDTYFDKIKGYTDFPKSKRMIVKTKQGYMRVGPGKEYPAFRVLSEGDSFLIAGRNSTLDSGHYWYIFKLSSGASGWIWGGEISE
ncbi:MAG: lytic transglycosylase domain-containing protein [bacterium]